MRLFKKLSSRIEYLDASQREIVRIAFDLAVKAHQKQKRHSGEPYVTHPVAVACILADMQFDVQTLAAALLHDVIEDSDYTRDDLAQLLGDEVADIVEGVSKLTKIEFKSRVEAQAENFRKMILAMIQDIRVILVKLADRLHNMRTLGPLRPDKKRRIAQETLEIYAPIARRLGMRQMYVELEELGFAGKYPNRQRILSKEILHLRGDRQKFLDMIHQAFQETLVQAGLPTCQIAGREKHLYSVYRKMRAKKLPFRQVMDVYAFRIIVDRVDTCYRVLGLLHSLYKPLPERFKDYIAIPKVNGYQSLHTTLFGPYGMPIEVQIRTTAMDEQASNGVAAHWRYKASDKQDKAPLDQASRWLKTLSELQSRAGSSIEFIESVKVDLFPEEIYVFTPKGRIKALPRGATVIDFAYMVHTAVGDSCHGALIDKQSVPLSTVLSSGQTIRILSSEQAEPDSSWLDFVVTGKARAAIRHHLKSKHRGQAICLGSEKLHLQLKQFALSADSIDANTWTVLLNKFGFAQRDELYAQIGSGQYAAELVARCLVDISERAYADRQQAAVQQQALPAADLIQNIERRQASFASCCQAMPEDPIRGVIDLEHGLLQIHAASCQSLAKLNLPPQQLLDLQWQAGAEANYAVQLDCVVEDRFGALAEVLACIDQLGAPVRDITIIQRERDIVRVRIAIVVRRRAHLDLILEAVAALAVIKRLQSAPILG